MNILEAINKYNPRGSRVAGKPDLGFMNLSRDQAIQRLVKIYKPIAQDMKRFAESQENWLSVSTVNAMSEEEKSRYLNNYAVSAGPICIQYAVEVHETEKGTRMIRVMTLSYDPQCVPVPQGAARRLASLFFDPGEKLKYEHDFNAYVWEFVTEYKRASLEVSSGHP